MSFLLNKKFSLKRINTRLYLIFPLLPTLYIFRCICWQGKYPYKKLFTGFNVLLTHLNSTIQFPSFVLCQKSFSYVLSPFYIKYPWRHNKKKFRANAFCKKKLLINDFRFYIYINVYHFATFLKVIEQLPREFIWNIW